MSCIICQTPPTSTAFIFIITLYIPFGHLRHLDRRVCVTTAQFALEPLYFAKQRLLLQCKNDTWRSKIVRAEKKRLKWTKRVSTILWVTNWNERHEGEERIARGLVDIYCAYLYILVSQHQFKILGLPLAIYLQCISNLSHWQTIGFLIRNHCFQLYRCLGHSQVHPQVLPLHSLLTCVLLRLRLRWTKFLSSTQTSSWRHF